MTTYNGARFIRQSIASVLAQTWHHFELIIVDDRSTDGTGDILGEIHDPRVRVIRNAVNAGVVKSRNRCFAEVRGTYAAMLDHDDLSRPTRLAKQIAYLDTHPRTVLVGTAAHVLDNGQLVPSKHPERTSPLLISWLLHVANPLICSSVMFRTSAVQRLGVFMRENYQYADDYDLYLRLKSLGDIAQLDEPLTIYRLHSGNAFRMHEETMIANAVKALAPTYAGWFGAEAVPAASLVVRHLSAGEPLPDAKTLDTLERYFRHLNRSFMATHEMDDADRKSILTHADDLWERMLRVTARHGGFKLSGRIEARPSGYWRSLGDGALLSLRWLTQYKTIRKLAREYLHRPAPPSKPPRSWRLFDTVYKPLDVDLSQPPTLFVVVDTEAEFDWNRPFDRTLTSVRSTAAQERAQAIFDGYGLRPIYVLDYAVASQPEGYEPIRRIFNRHACAIGAHMHPWINPPFEETVSDYNSFGGNLPPALEEAKLRALIAVIEQGFGVSPLFFKAGRYGLGPSTIATLARLGFAVDFSILPGADLRWRGGADFRFAEAKPSRAIAHDILSIPMTRGKTGVLAGLPSSMNTLFSSSICRKFRIPGILARTGLVNMVTLTPEGVSAEEQIRLIRSLAGRGHRVFILHYHSSSLVPGNTPYVTTEKGLAEFLGRIATVCSFFFRELGGMPGNPADLVPSEMRNFIWPCNDFAEGVTIERGWGAA